MAAADTAELAFGTAVFGTVEVFLPFVAAFATSAAGFETGQELRLPAGAVVTRAVLTVTAEAPASAVSVGDIATVRAAAGAPSAPSSSLVIDFGGLRTVSSVSGPSAVKTVTAWRGTRFDQSVLSAGTTAYAEFTEVQTERLLVELLTATSPASFADSATLTTTTPPADLELLVGGARAWLRGGAVPAGLSEQVDVTAALQEALTRTPPTTNGDVVVPVTLRARVPGMLGLSLAQPIGFLRTHTVALPGPTTTRSFDEEGEVVLPLPLPAGSESWTIHRVLATVAATDDDPRRVLPPVGPDRSGAAELVLDPDRRLVARLPEARFAPFERLVGLRVAVQPAAGGVELGGALVADAAGLPGEPVPKGTFTPVTLDEAQGPRFVTLPLAQPVEVAADAPLWFTLAATRGTAVVGLTEGGDPASDVTLRRVLPNGTVRAMSSPVGIRTDVLQLRVAGIAPALQPIDVLTVDLVGGATVREPVTDPALTAAGLVSLGLTPPAPRPGLALRLTATGPTTVTVGPVVVAYAEAADSTTGGSP